MASLFAELDGEVLVFDGVLSENWEFSGTVVDHPVEDYAFVTDHRQRKPNTISIRAVITATPFIVEGQQSAGANRYRRARKFLEEYAQKSIFTYSSFRMGIVENLMIENFSFDVDNQDRIEFTIDLKEVVFGRTELVELPPIREPRAQPPVDRCPQPGQEVLFTPVPFEPNATPTPARQFEEQRARTLLDRLTGGFITQDVRASVGDDAANALQSVLGN
jgi:hypothetical protein